MEIRQINEGKKRWLSLLLLGDEQEDMVDRYLERGEMFLLTDGEAQAVGVVTQEENGTFELKNLAVASPWQRKGYGFAMVKFLLERYRFLGRSLLVGTGESPLTLPFYEKCGFCISHRVPDFFLRNYDHPIYEAGRQLTDLVYLRRELFVLETERLRLRCLSSADREALVPVLGDPEVMYAWGHGFSMEEIDRWIRQNQSRYREYGYGYWAAVEKESGRLVGQMGLLPEVIDGKLHLGLGWILRRDAWGKGYAAEGGKACMELGFDRWKAPEVIAEIRPENAASCRVAERLGMRVAGRFVKVYQGQEMPHLIYKKTREGK